MDKAIIIAGGKGERLRPLTNEIPKPMIPVLDNKPLLWFLLGWLRSQGIRQVVVCCGYLHEVIINYFGDGKTCGLKIDYLIEDQPLGRGGALKRGIKHFADAGVLDNEPLLALNGDLMTELKLQELATFHRAHKGLATIVTTPLVSPYGIVEIEGSNILSFAEKPRLPYWINAGIYCLDPSILKFLPDKGDHEVDTFPLLAKQGTLHAFTSNAFWKTVDTMKDLTDLRKEIPDAVLQMGAVEKPVI